MLVKAWRGATDKGRIAQDVMADLVCDIETLGCEIDEGNATSIFNEAGDVRIMAKLLEHAARNIAKHAETIQSEAFKV